MSKTKAWEQYEQGVDYKQRIGLYSTVDVNERFYAGDQWVGIPHEGLPTPVINFIKYASAWKIAAVTDRRLGLRFFAEGESDGGDICTYAQQISAYCDKIWERLKMDYITKEGLKQAAVTGDYVQYFYWDSGRKTGQALTGDIGTMLIDNVNYYPGNPNSPDVQDQPYIILAFRELVAKVREEAKANGCRRMSEIVADDDNDHTAGDMGKIEMDESGKCNVLLKMYKKDGHVYAEKSVRDVVIQKEKDTNLTMYPVALMNWETRKNSAHGVAEVTGLIPNQVFVNKILALSQLNQVQTSFPKVIFDKTRIKEWTNKVAGAIPVNGDIGGAAQYLAPPNMAYDAWRGLETTLDTTMRMMGANDVTLGNVSNPDNTSAFIAARDAAMVPLQSQQERFYAFIEDVGRIWLDFIKNFYKEGRMIPVMDGDNRVYVPLETDVLDAYTMDLHVDVGPSSLWSEIQVLQTLDNLLANGKITFTQYLERLPDGHIPMKEALLAEVSEAEKAALAMNGTPGGAGAMPPMDGAMLPMDGAMPPMDGAMPPMDGAMPPMDGAMPPIPMDGANETDGAVDMAGLAGMMGANKTGDAGGAMLPMDGEMPPMDGANTDIVMDMVAMGVEDGVVPVEIAEAMAALAEQGAGDDMLITVLQNAADKGEVPQEFVNEVIAAMQIG